jgi:hypothetical protein
MMTPGDTPTARMPWRPYCVAMLRVRALIALFDVPYIARTSAERIASVELVSMTTPPPCLIITGSALYSRARTTPT